MKTLIILLTISLFFSCTQQPLEPDYKDSDVQVITITNTVVSFQTNIVYSTNYVDVNVNVNLTNYTFITNESFITNFVTNIHTNHITNEIVKRFRPYKMRKYDLDNNIQFNYKFDYNPTTIVRTQYTGDTQNYVSTVTYTQTVATYNQGIYMCWNL